MKQKLSKVSQDAPIRSITPALYTRSRNREITGRDSVLGRSLDLELQQRTQRLEKVKTSDSLTHV